MGTALILSFILMVSLFGMIWVEAALVQSKKLATAAPRDVRDTISLASIGSSS